MNRHTLSFLRPILIKCTGNFFRTVYIIGREVYSNENEQYDPLFFSNSMYDRKNNAEMKMNSTIHQKSEQYI